MAGENQSNQHFIQGLVHVCKTVIIRLTLFSQANNLGYIQETLLSRP